MRIFSPVHADSSFHRQGHAHSLNGRDSHVTPRCSLTPCITPSKYILVWRISAWGMFKTSLLYLARINISLLVGAEPPLASFSVILLKRIWEWFICVYEYNWIFTSTKLCVIYPRVLALRHHNCTFNWAFSSMHLFHPIMDTIVVSFLFLSFFLSFSLRITMLTYNFCC